MNILRLIAIALPAMLLIGCGGGGGTAATPFVNPFASLAAFEPTEDSQAITTIGEIVSTASMNYGIGVNSPVYSVSNVAETDNFGSEIANSCTNAKFCRVTIGETRETLNGPGVEFADLTLIERGVFQQYNSRITPILTRDGVNFARGELRAVRTNIDQFEIQTFAGWLDGSVFATMQTAIGESNPSYQFWSYSIGDSAGSNPAGTGEATWEGATVASIKATRTFIQGDATITIPDLANADVDLEFDNWRNIASGRAASSVSAITYTDLTLTDGSFTGSGNEQVQGRFYGTDHNEVGGFFNTETVTGAFGGTKQ